MHFVVPLAALLVVERVLTAPTRMEEWEQFGLIEPTDDAAAVSPAIFDDEPSDDLQPFDELVDSWLKPSPVENIYKSSGTIQMNDDAIANLSNHGNSPIEELVDFSSLKSSVLQEMDLSALEAALGLTEESTDTAMESVSTSPDLNDSKFSLDQDVDAFDLIRNRLDSLNADYDASNDPDGIQVDRVDESPAELKRAAISDQSDTESVVSTKKPQPKRKKAMCKINSSKRRKTEMAKSAVSRRLYSAAEDDLIRKMVSQNFNFKQITHAIKDQLGIERSVISVQMRWEENLDPKVNTGPFSDAEDTLLKLLVASHPTSTPWRQLMAHFKNRTSTQLKIRWKSLLKQQEKQEGKVKRKWSRAYDAQLLDLYDELGVNWAEIARRMGGWEARQVRDRYTRVLDPSLKKGRWTKDENAILKREMRKYPDQVLWTEIAKHLPGRTPDAIHFHWRYALDPTINHGAFTKQEQGVIRKMRSEGSSWADIAAASPGRVTTQVIKEFKRLEKNNK